MTAKTKKTRVNFKTKKTLDDYLQHKRPDLAKIHENPTPRMRLALNLFSLRKKASLTQKQAADKCGLGPATYQRYEEAQPSVNPTQNKLINICEAYGVDIVDLYKPVKI